MDPSDEAIRKKEQVFLGETKALRKIIKSAQKWQQRSWLTRAFRRWEAPKLPPQTTATRAAGPEEALRQRVRAVFNDAWYLSQNPNAAESDLSPMEHYRTVGWKAGWNPHPLFDVAWYLQQNPEVAAAGQEPLQHYLEHGWEQRRFPHRFFDPAFYLRTYFDSSATQVTEPLSHYLRLGWMRDRQISRWGRLDWMPGFFEVDQHRCRAAATRHLGAHFPTWLEERDPARSVILLIVHESTPAGASRLFLDLARKLYAKHDVIVFDLTEDARRTQFQEASHIYLGFGHRKASREEMLPFILNLLLAHCKIHYALVGSLYAARAIGVLTRHDVPVVHFIPELADSFCPAIRHRKVLGELSRKIFTSEAVRQSALEVEPKMALAQSLVLAPAVAPEPPSTSDSVVSLRPTGWENAIVVLGAGPVESILGTDVFFSAGAEIIRRNPAKNVRFIWLDTELPNEEPHFFRAELQSILRELDDAAEIIPVTDDASSFFSSADLFFAPARMDPFPWPFSQAMHAGLAVVAFSGAADALPNECVVPDLDAACAKLQNLLDSTATRLEISAIGREWAKNRCDFDSYLQSVENAVAAQTEIALRAIEDRRTITELGVLDLDFLRSPLRPEIWADPTRWYVLTSLNGIHSRKPFPGFHPGIYAENHPGLTTEPLVDYLRTGKPDGPWQFEVIRPALDSEKMVAPPASVALHIHLFYADMAEEIARRLRRNQRRVDLFVSVTSDAAAEIAREHLAGCALNRLEVASVPNRGRDIGPFFTAFGEALREYEIVGHLHTKKSIHSQKSGSVAFWTDFLFENLIGGKAAMLDAILDKMLADPTLGIVFPDDPNVIGWTENREFAESIATRLSLPQPLPEEINFPAGTFFWARPAALQKLFDQRFQWEDFPAEPLPNDGTMLHAIERLLPIVCNSAGFSTAVTHVPGVTR